jgi:Spy/CpxP family protein refolding chaperone
MERAFHDGQFGRWWNNPDLAQKLGFTDQQKKQMDDIFLQLRLKLIDLNANLEKQETLLHPLIEADQPDEAKILSQIDAVAQARADLEKANARMLFDIRKTLPPDQWQKLKALRTEVAPVAPMVSGGSIARVLRPTAQRRPLQLRRDRRQDRHRRPRSPTNKLGRTT